MGIKITRLFCTIALQAQWLELCDRVLVLHISLIPLRSREFKDLHPNNSLFMTVITMQCIRQPSILTLQPLYALSPGSGDEYRPGERIHYSPGI